MAIQTTVAQPTRHRFTVAEYYRMAEAGIFDEDSRVELIDGDIVDMPPIGPSHSEGVDRLAETLITRLTGVARVRIQNPVHLREHNEPEPDIVLARRRQGGYAHGHPTPEDILLIVEVADSSPEYDRQTKGPMYARRYRRLLDPGRGPRPRPRAPRPDRGRLRHHPYLPARRTTQSARLPRPDAHGRRRAGLIAAASAADRLTDGGSSGRTSRARLGGRCSVNSPFGVQSTGAPGPPRNGARPPPHGTWHRPPYSLRLKGGIVA